MRRQNTEFRIEEDSELRTLKPQTLNTELRTQIPNTQFGLKFSCLHPSCWPKMKSLIILWTMAIISISIAKAAPDFSDCEQVVRDASSETDGYDYYSQQFVADAFDAGGGTYYAYFRKEANGKHYFLAFSMDARTRQVTPVSTLIF